MISMKKGSCSNGLIGPGYDASEAACNNACISDNRCKYTELRIVAGSAKCYRYFKEGATCTTAFPGLYSIFKKIGIEGSDTTGF